MGGPDYFTSWSDQEARATKLKWFAEGDKSSWKLCQEHDWVGRFSSVSTDRWAENGSWGESERAECCLWSLKGWIGSIGEASEGSVQEDYELPSSGTWLHRLGTLCMQMQCNGSVACRVTIHHQMYILHLNTILEGGRVIRPFSRQINLSCNGLYLCQYLLLEIMMIRLFVYLWFPCSITHTPNVFYGLLSEKIVHAAIPEIQSKYQSPSPTRSFIVML